MQLCSSIGAWPAAFYVSVVLAAIAIAAAFGVIPRDARKSFNRLTFCVWTDGILVSLLATLTLPREASVIGR